MAKQMRCRITNEHLLKSTVSHPEKIDPFTMLQWTNLYNSVLNVHFRLKQINGYNSFTGADPVSVCAPHLTCCLRTLPLLCFVCARFNSIAFILYFDQRHLFSVNWICVCLSVCLNASCLQEAEKWLINCLFSGIQFVLKMKRRSLLWW